MQKRRTPSSTNVFSGSIIVREKQAFVYRLSICQLLLVRPEADPSSPRFFWSPWMLRLKGDSILHCLLWIARKGIGFKLTTAENQLSREIFLNLYTVKAKSRVDIWRLQIWHQIYKLLELFNTTIQPERQWSTSLYISCQDMCLFSLGHGHMK